MSSEIYDSCEAGVSVTSRPPVRVLRPRTDVNQAKKRPREPETDALPAVEPPEKRSRWHLPGFLHGIFSQKQNGEVPAWNIQYVKPRRTVKSRRLAHWASDPTNLVDLHRPD